MKYDDILKYWVEANSDRMPKRVINQADNLPAFLMSPEKINALLNSEDVYDLYRKPAEGPAKTDYQSAAINWDQATGDGALNNFVLFSSKKPKSALSAAILPNEGEYGDIPKSLHKFIPQAIYEHEYQHSIDNRIDQKQGAPFKFGGSAYDAYLKRMTQHFIDRGIPAKDADKIARREAPAMAREDMFWDSFRS